MGKHFKVKKKAYELANGKIQVVPFDKLDMKPFTMIYRNATEKELRDFMILLSPEGVWYIDSRNEAAEFFANALEILVLESRYSLESFRKAYAMKFKGVTLENVNELETDSDKSTAIGWILTPYELQRRDISQAYYKSSKIKAFPGGKM